MTGVRVEVEGVSRTYRRGGAEIAVLRDVSAVLEPGERVAIVGPSGAGKSSLLHVLGMLDPPDHGTVRLDGVDVTALPEGARDRLRNRRVGFVFQAHHLLADHDALGNVMTPVRLGGGSVAVARARASALLDAVGLGHRFTHRPGQLSGGEQQRVAIARALVMGPGLVLADEPTGNLDPATADDVFHLLLELNRQLGSTLVVVTHAHALAARFPRRLTLREGRLVDA
jgi:lipoprotein-releasing system ATP-binding protein